MDSGVRIVPSVFKVITALVIAITVLGCGSAPSPAPSSTSAAKSDPQWTVVGTYRQTSLKVPTGTAPRPKGIYLVAIVRVANPGSSVYSAPVLPVVDAGGTTFQPVATAFDLQPAQQTGPLSVNPGATADATLVYEIPEAARDLALVTPSQTRVPLGAGANP
jgi:hypothetical protein